MQKPKAPGPVLRNELPDGAADGVVVVLCTRDDGRVVVRLERPIVDEHSTEWTLRRTTR